MEDWTREKKNNAYLKYARLLLEHACPKICIRTPCVQTLRLAATIGAVTLVILPLGKLLLPTGKQLFVCNRHSQSEITLGKLPWIRQKEQKNFP